MSSDLIEILIYIGILLIVFLILFPFVDDDEYNGGHGGY